MTDFIIETRQYYCGMILISRSKKRTSEKISFYLKIFLSITLQNVLIKHSDVFKCGYCKFFIRNMKFNA